MDGSETKPANRRRMNIRGATFWDYYDRVRLHGDDRVWVRAARTAFVPLGLLPEDWDAPWRPTRVNRWDSVGLSAYASWENPEGLRSRRPDTSLVLGWLLLAGLATPWWFDTAAWTRDGSTPRGARVTDAQDNPVQGAPTLTSWRAAATCIRDRDDCAVGIHPLLTTSAPLPEGVAGHDPSIQHNHELTHAATAAFERQRGREARALHQAFETPLLAIVPQVGRSHRGSLVVANPRLLDLRAHEVWSAATVAMRVHEALDNWLLPPDPARVTVADAVRVRKHGFDAVHGFRRRPPTAAS